MRRAPPKPGLVIWITGLSGSGKSTVSALVVEQLRASKIPVVLLDGDVVREVLGGDLGYSRNDRIENAFRICRLARLFSQQGLTVVCATMSLFKQCHAWNREHLQRYLEVLLDVPLEELRRRDPKGLYRKVAGGHASGVAGVDQEYDLPVKPHLRIRNLIPMTASSAARKILAAARRSC